MKRIAVALAAVMAAMSAIPDAMPAAPSHIPTGDWRVGETDEVITLGENRRFKSTSQDFGEGLWEYDFATSRVTMTTTQDDNFELVRRVPMNEMCLIQGSVCLPFHQPEPLTSDLLRQLTANMSSVQSLSSIDDAIGSRTTASLYAVYDASGELVDTILVEPDDTADDATRISYLEDIIEGHGGIARKILDKGVVVVDTVEAFAQWFALQMCSLYYLPNQISFQVGISAGVGVVASGSVTTQYDMKDLCSKVAREE